MCKIGFNFLQLYFSLSRVREKVEFYRGKVDLTKRDKDITNYFISKSLK